MQRLAQVGRVVRKHARVEQALGPDGGVVGVVAVLGEGDGQSLRPFRHGVGQQAHAVGLEAAAVAQIDKCVTGVRQVGIRE